MLCTAILPPDTCFRILGPRIYTICSRACHGSALATTGVFDTFWRFAAERLAIYYRRLADDRGPWTNDAILRAYRFTNSYRAADRVSQYLIREVQYHPERSQEPREVFYRTLLFKFFNKIETWESLEAAHGPITWRHARLEAMDATLSGLTARGRAIYSAAYIMPAPPFGCARKHSNHLRLLARMMDDDLPADVSRSPDLRTVYERILAYPGLGKFLAFQYAIDLNYSTLLDFSEADFVVAGPGALDGIAKCFESTRGHTPEQVIHWVTERQSDEFQRRGLDFPGLFGRPLQPIDVQNLFCEVSKYARVAHPEVTGVAGRERIKQGYRGSAGPMERPTFPPRWGLSVFAVEHRRDARDRQTQLFS